MPHPTLTTAAAILTSRHFNIPDTVFDHRAETHVDVIREGIADVLNVIRDRLGESADAVSVGIVEAGSAMHAQLRDGYITPKERMPPIFIVVTGHIPGDIDPQKIVSVYTFTQADQAIFRDDYKKPVEIYCTHLHP